MVGVLTRVRRLRRHARLAKREGCAIIPEWPKVSPLTVRGHPQVERKANTGVRDRGLAAAEANSIVASKLVLLFGRPPRHSRPSSNEGKSQHIGVCGRGLAAAGVTDSFPAAAKPGNG